MTDEYFDGLEDLLADAEEAAGLSGAVDKARAENRVLADACEFVSEMSEAGAMSEAQVSSLASQLSGIVDNYNKTDIKNELQPHYQEEKEGVPFNKLIEERLEEVQVVHTTDHKQSTVWRWRFSDGVQLETETSKDGGRGHHAWPAFKNDYFDELIAMGRGERIGKPEDELRDAEEWRRFIDDVILDHAEPVEHVGPRTEAVRLLRDYVGRSPAYLDMDDVRNRQGLWIDNTINEDDDAVADGGTREIRVPFEQIKRVCDMAGITTRALQIELEARNLVPKDISGVSDAVYVDNTRVPFWTVTTALEEPDTIIEDPETPAEKAARREKERLEEERTDVGAVDDDGTDSNDDTDSDDDRQVESDVDDTDEQDHTRTPRFEEDDEDDEIEPGERNSFGVDPDKEDDEGDSDG